MAGGNRRMCRCRLKLFRPDLRNRRHQRYCSAPACRAAGKAASHARWLTGSENQGYFHGPENFARVQAGGARHPEYWRRGRSISSALQWRNPLIRLAKPLILQGDRYKRS
jgi:hypothetical protein